MSEYQSLSTKPELDSEGVEVQRTTPRVSVEERDNRITLSYEFPGFFLSDPAPFPRLEKQYRHIRIDDTGGLMRGGKPRLPSLGRYVQIPFNCDFRFEIRHTTKPKVFSDVNVAPAQSKLTDRSDTEPEIECDDNTYDSSDPYPQESVTVEGPVVIDGYNALLVHVCPFQCVPAKTELTAYPELEIDIILKEREAEPDDLAGPESEDNLEAFGNLFVNPLPYPSRGEDLPTPGTGPAWPLPEDPEFLIIYHGEFKSAAEKLAIWKMKCGIRTETHSIDDVGNSPDRIKEFIRDRRRPKMLGPVRFRPRLRYVMLLGDAPDLIEVHEVAYDAFMAADLNRTDYYYSTPRDPQGPADLVLPWLSIGRVPARTAAKAHSVVDQIIRYERFPSELPGYYQNITLTGEFATALGYPCESFQNYLPTLEKIRERLNDTDVVVERIYTGDNPDSRDCHELINVIDDGEPLPFAVAQSLLPPGIATARLIEALEQGRLLVAHRGHGSIEGPHLPKLDCNTVNGLGSLAQSIVLSVNCETGKFDAPRAVESFAEVMLRIPGGAPSLIAACRDSNPYLNDHLILALFDALWGGVLPTYPDDSTASYPVRRHRVGDILNYAKAYLPIAFEGPKSIKDHLEIYHLLGDPTLEVWRRPPREIELTTRVRPVCGFGLRLDVTMSSCPDGSVITMWYGDELLKRVEPHTPAFSIGFDRDCGRKNGLTLCFKAPGYRFGETSIGLA